ncbi:MAG: hypothetical protein LQ346_004821 [Caloplaca aetnensis]|nr:MAG: hypothetical protein LQ346_004821 [Caloplaca aetnensis]
MEESHSKTKASDKLKPPGLDGEQMSQVSEDTDGTNLRKGADVATYNSGKASETRTSRLRRRAMKLPARVWNTRRGQDTTSGLVAGEVERAQLDRPPSAGLVQTGKGVRRSLGASQSSNASSKSRFTREIRIVLLSWHEPEMEVTALLDSGLDVDIISRLVVDSFGLQTSSYTGDMDGVLIPDAQVTVMWRLAEVHETYTTIFGVLNEEDPTGFDVMLGHNTIQMIGFNKKPSVSWRATGDREPRPLNGKGKSNHLEDVGFVVDGFQQASTHSAESIQTPLDISAHQRQTLHGADLGRAIKRTGRGTQAAPSAASVAQEKIITEF